MGPRDPEMQPGIARVLENKYSKHANETRSVFG